MTDALVYVVGATISFFLAVFVLLGIFGAKAGVRSIGETKTLQLILILLTIGATALPAAIRISSGIDLDDPRNLLQIEENIGFFVWAKRYITLSILVVAFSGVVRTISRLFFDKIHGRALLFAYLAFVFLSFLLGAVFSTVPALVLPLYYPLVVLLLLFLSVNANMNAVISTARTCIGLILVGSLVISVYPKWAYILLGNNLIPAIPGRLAGITAHPNDLGPLSLTYILLALAAPLRSRSAHYFFLVVAFVTLILSQSKTAWIATAIALSFIIAYGFFSTWKMQSRNAIGWPLAGIFGILSSLAIISLFAMLALSGALPSKLLSSKAVDNLTTFVGRTEIWNITLGLWERNPWFGYGPTIWSPEFRIQYLMLYVGQAHNQFVQTLGDSGLFGLAGLVIYLAAVGLTAVKTVSVSRGLSIAIIIQFLVRCMTESPLRSMGVSDASFLMHFIVVIMLLAWVKQKAFEQEKGACS